MLSPEALERAYNVRAAIPEHPAIFARWRAESLRALDELRSEQDYYYGPSPAETLDFFPAHRNRAPLLVFIHGGYWRSLDKSDFSFIAPAFVAAGVSVAVVNYGLAPATRLEEMVRQMLRAIAWLYRHAADLGVDPNRIHVAGHSAGGHLAGMLLAADWPAWSRDLPPRPIKGAVCISGLFDLVPVARAPFLRDDLALDDEAAARLSPANYPPAVPVPVIAAVGELESDEFHRQSRLLAETWENCRVSVMTLPGRHHLSAVEALAEPDHPLFRSTLKLVNP